MTLFLVRAMGACALAFGVVASAQAADVGVSVQISQPGVYGRIDIGRFPTPQVVLPSPVVIRPVVVLPSAPPPQPVYMWVPPGHQKNWGKHCQRYQACGVPVYFVQDRWYDEHVNQKGHGKGKGRGRDDEDHGHGKGHGKRD